MKIKKNDNVKMLAGKDTGKTGKVLRVYPTEGKVTVENLNLMKKHNRPKREGEKGQRVEVPRKINISNVSLVCPTCGKATRVGYIVSSAGKVRMCKKCKAQL